MRWWWPRFLPLAALLLAAPLGAQQAARAPVAPARFEGVPIRLVYLDLRDSAGAEIADPALRAAVDSAVAIPVGAPFSQLFADVAIQRVRAVPGVVAARWELYETAMPGSVVLAVRVTAAPSGGAAPARGWIATGRAGEFPLLLETAHSLLRVQLNGGLGAFHEWVPWYGDADAFVGGSPLFPDPATGSATWAEYSVEAGLYGATRVAGPVYLFGSGSAVAAGSVGQDPWRSDLRFELEVERAYVGTVIDLPGKDVGLSLTYGKLAWQLNQGFLFSQFAGSFNAAQWGASYTAPRIALQQAAIAKARLGKFSLEGFFIDPQEYRERDSGTQYLGVHARFNDPRTFDVGLAFYGVPRSETRYALPDGATGPREGLRTFNARLVSSRAGGVPGLQLEGEYAYQWNTNFPMAANAGYVQLGYESPTRDWHPNLSYRFGYFQGDDPATRTFERFDAPQSSGSDNWLQGNILRKAVVNSNVLSHRVRLGLSPRPGMNLVLSWFHLWADQRNNLGGSKPLQQLAGDTFGDEVDLTLSWGVSRHLFLLALAGVAIPGDAIDQALAGRAELWRSLQLSLFWAL